MNERKRAAPEARAKEKAALRCCETCEFYDAIDEDGTLGCVVDLDEDELARERTDSRNVCPYYRYYDEYRLVRKQN